MITRPSERLERIGTEAERTGVSTTQIRELIKAGKIAGFKVGTLLLIRPSDLDRYIVDHQVTPVGARSVREKAAAAS